MKDEDSIEMKFVRFLCGLALLPEVLIPIAANSIYEEWLIQHAGAENLEKLFSDSKKDIITAELSLQDKNFSIQEESNSFLEFFDDYFEQQWLKKVGSENFSVYGKEKRTNNDCENYHSQLPLYFNKKGTFVDFIRKLKK